MGNTACCKKPGDAKQDASAPSEAAEIRQVVGDEEPPLWKTEAELQQKGYEEQARAKAEAEEAAAALAQQQASEESNKAPKEDDKPAVVAAKAKPSPSQAKRNSKDVKKRRPEEKKKKDDAAKSLEEEKEKPGGEEAAAAAAVAEEPVKAKEISKPDKIAVAAAKKERDQKWKRAPDAGKADLVEKLLAAAQSGNISTVDALFGDTDWLSPDAADKDGFTALHVAANHGHKDLCKMLIKRYAADPLITIKLGEWGNTPLHFAARGNHLDAVKYLASKGKGALRMKNNQGKTPAEMAGHSGDVHDYLDDLE
mmetsp:Transcript_4234/g.11925  ORF Transcript_4234/g.11925 Transcript_4234/m.11925 type:complete len:310 (+) Transcript_4234:86-1015(+)